jgi:hypothetical protein
MAKKTPAGTDVAIMIFNNALDFARKGNVLMPLSGPYPVLQTQTLVTHVDMCTSSLSVTFRFTKIFNDSFNDFAEFQMSINCRNDNGNPNNRRIQIR